MAKKNPWKIVGIACAVLLVAALGLLGYTYSSRSRLQLDSAARSNQPTFIDPVADLKVQNNAIADSWFVVSNLKSGDREFGILVHQLKNPGGYFPTIAVTDVNDHKYLLDEIQGGSVTSTKDGFEVKSDNIQWVADGQTMKIQGKMKSGDGSFDLTLVRKGSVLAYNGTGYFPLVDSDWPTCVNYSCQIRTFTV